MISHKENSCCGGKNQSSKAGENVHIDPICGMTVDAGTAKNSYEYEGKKYYFCCSGCLKKFVADPDKYL